MNDIHPALANDDVQIGEFLIQNGIITREVFEEASALQRDNPTRLIGEILVTLRAIPKENLIMAIEMYLVMTDSSVQHTNEWLDQDEIDILIAKLEAQRS